MHKLAFDERLGMLVGAQWLSRENKRLVRALKEAQARQRVPRGHRLSAPPASLKKQ
jgi:hypothetical protein